MGVTRRTFLGGLAAGMVAAPRALGAVAGIAARKIDTVGLQLYTVRDDMQKDFEGTLAKVAAIGYREVEFAGYFNQSPANVRAILARHGLKSPSTHVDYASLDEDKWPAVVEASHTIGHAFIVMPWFDDATRAQPDIWKKASEKFNRAAAVSRKAGIQFAYHNHNFEFAGVEGARPYDLLLADCDPSLVKFEMDLCWIEAAGQDPLTYFRKYPGRFPMVHAKDLKTLPTPPAPGAPAPPIDQLLPDVTDVGSGVIDWKRIFADSTQAGVQHYFVEHDQPASPFASITASYTYLRALRF
jgi:sugar phosphate isomerase/epimerase